MSTLTSLFEKNKQQFRIELSSIVLPRDVKKLQSFMNDFFINKVSVDEYKRELSLSEIAMLNSAMKLVASPISMVNEWTIVDAPSNSRKTNKRSESGFDLQSLIEKMDIPVISATAAGGAIGGLLFKTWGGVLLSIAGSALTMYLRSGQKQVEKPINIKIDVDKYISTLKQICSNIDDIMGNYKTGLSNLKKSYERAPKITLSSGYKPLLNRLASLYIAIDSNTLPEEVKSEFDKLYRTLKNHHYEILGYNENSRQYYVETPSPHVTEVTIVKAAILENGDLFEMGECLIPEQK